MTAPSATYELPLEAVDDASPGRGDVAATDALPREMLLYNACWVCRLRWVVSSVLLCLGILSVIPGLFQGLGLLPNRLWPFVTSGILAVLNLVISRHARGLAGEGRTDGEQLSLWTQILVDLVILTAVVHYVGSHETVVGFAYLFHIVLACIFFSRAQSLCVTVVACAFFSLLTLAEWGGVLEARSIYGARLQAGVAAPLPHVVAAVTLVSTQAVWFVVWYLASHLSALVRLRDRELAQANDQLRASQEERAKHMLRVTHELKSPFAAIHANAQLLMEGYCGTLPDKAHEVAGRIAARSRRLGREIQDMLQLANLSAKSLKTLQSTSLDLQPILRWCIEQARPLAEERHIVLECNGTESPLPATGIEDHFKMLFTNLLTNALIYSNVGDRVTVTRSLLPGRRPRVQIEDRGLGIAADKLPKVFDDYYRTREATEHWPESTGLGLAIVRGVAEKHGVRTQVTSEVGVGTRFDLCFPNSTEGTRRLRAQEDLAEPGM